MQLCIINCCLLFLILNNPSSTISDKILKNDKLYQYLNLIPIYKINIINVKNYIEH